MLSQGNLVISYNTHVVGGTSHARDGYGRDMIVNITDPKRKVNLGEPCFNNEYLLFSLDVETLNTSVLCDDYNTYIDGELYEM